MYIENVVSVMKRELMEECDYVREASCNERFGELLKNDPVFLVPKVYKNLTTKNILVNEFIEGEPFDKCDHLPQETKNYVISLFFNPEIVIKTIYIYFISKNSFIR